MLPTETGPLPPWLHDTYAMIHSAFPEGIPDEAYRPLLIVLNESMSQRSLAKLMVFCTGKDYATVYNDVLTIQFPIVSEKPDHKVIEPIKELLLAHGYEDWLKRD